MKTSVRCEEMRSKKMFCGGGIVKDAGSMALVRDREARFHAQVEVLCPQNKIETGCLRMVGFFM
jgi:hypothetical protein